MSDEEEEARAAAYRQSVRKRIQFQANLRIKLQGSPSARLSLLNNWDPLRKALIEQGQGVIPDE